MFDDYNAIQGWISKDRVDTPDEDNKETYDEYYEVYKKLYQDVKEDMHKLSRIS